MACLYYLHPLHEIVFFVLCVIHIVASVWQQLDGRRRMPEFESRKLFKMNRISAVSISFSWFPVSRWLMRWFSSRRHGRLRARWIVGVSSVNHRSQKKELVPPARLIIIMSICLLLYDDSLLAEGCACYFVTWPIRRPPEMHVCMWKLISELDSTQQERWLYGCEQYHLCGIHLNLPVVWMFGGRLWTD